MSRIVRPLFKMHHPRVLTWVGFWMGCCGPYCCRSVRPCGNTPPVLPLYTSREGGRTNSKNFGFCRPPPVTSGLPDHITLYTVQTTLLYLFHSSSRPIHSDESFRIALSSSASER